MARTRKTPAAPVAAPAHVPNGPAWFYRQGADGIDARIFEDGVQPEGWHDTPAHLTSESAP